MEELDEIDRVLHSLRANWTTYGVWADWFDERGCDRIGDWLRANGENIPAGSKGASDYERGMFLFHFVTQLFGDELWRFGEDVYLFYHETYRRAFDNFTVTARLRETLEELRGVGDIRHIPLRHHSANRLVIPHQCTGTGTLKMTSGDHRWEIPNWGDADLRRQKIGNSWYYDKRHGRFTSYRYIGRCDTCGQVFMDDPPQPWHVELEIGPYSMDDFRRKMRAKRLSV